MIYFAQRQSDSAIKIGFSLNIMNRLQQLKYEHGKLTLLGWYPGDRDLEKELHKDFFRARIEGEWFRPVPSLKDYIRDNSWDIAPEKFPKTILDVVKARQETVKYIRQLETENLELKKRLKIIQGLAIGTVSMRILDDNGNEIEDYEDIFK